MRVLANLYVWGGFANYAYVFSRMVEPVQNSLPLAAVATLCWVVFGTLTGYVADRKRFAGKWAVDLTIMLPFILPGIGHRRGPARHLQQRPGRAERHGRRRRGRGATRVLQPSGYPTL